MVQRLIVPDDKRPPVRTEIPAQMQLNQAEPRSGGLSQALRIASWIGVIAGVGLGGLILLGGMTSAQSAPQEAVVVSLSIACAVLPYCFARAVSEITRE